MTGGTGLISTTNFGRHVIVAGRRSLFRKSKFIGLMVKVKETGATAQVPLVPMGGFAVAVSALSVLLGLVWHDLAETLVGVVACVVTVPMLVLAVQDRAGIREALKSKYGFEL